MNFAQNHIVNKPFDISITSTLSHTTVPIAIGSVWDKGYRYGFNGMEKDKDIGIDDYDFGARIYDGRLGRWLSLDPLMDEYPYVSNYSFGLNAPIYFKDFDGNVIIGTDGKPITFEIQKSEDGKFHLEICMGSIISNSDAFKIMSALVLSEKGRETLKTMNSSNVKYKVKKLKIKTGSNNAHHGETKSFGARFKDNRLKSPKITIYTDYEQMYSDRFSALEGLDVSYYINVVSVHEIMGHCESSLGATIDVLDYKGTNYSKNLSKRTADAYNNGTYDENNSLKKEEEDFNFGYMEYDKIKLEYGNTKEILNNLLKDNVITQEDYDKRMKIVSDNELKLDTIREIVIKRIEAEKTN